MYRWKNYCFLFLKHLSYCVELWRALRFLTINLLKHFPNSIIYSCEVHRTYFKELKWLQQIGAEWAQKKDQGNLCEKVKTSSQSVKLRFSSWCDWEEMGHYLELSRDQRKKQTTSKTRNPHKVHLTLFILQLGSTTAKWALGYKQLHHVRPSKPNPHTTKKWDTPCPDSWTLGLCNLESQVPESSKTQEAKTII